MNFRFKNWLVEINSILPKIKSKKSTKIRVQREYSSTFDEIAELEKVKGNWLKV